jgi:hypothetical protein
MTLSTALNKNYPYKVWAITVLLGPYLGLLTMMAYRTYGYEWSMLYGPLVLGVLSAIFTFPAFGLYYLLFLRLGKRIRSVYLFKSVLCLYCCTIIFVIFYIMNPEILNASLNMHGFLFFMSFIVANLVPGLLFKARYKNVREQ